MESTISPQVSDPSSSPSSNSENESEPTSSMTSVHSPSLAASPVETSSSSGNRASTSGAYPIRRRRNPAVLIRWIEDHPFNPYPTKVEKQGLAFYAGMTQRQLNDWFANARRNIKKVGYENWKKKHSGFSAILSGIPFAAGSNCNFSLLSTATSTNNNGNANNGGGSSGGINSAFTNTAFTIAPLNRPSSSTSGTPCNVMSYASNGPMTAMSLASMATCVKPTPLSSPAGFVKVEGGGTYYGGYSLPHAGADNSSISPCSSSASSVCLPSLPFSNESYQLTTGHAQAAASGPVLTVDGTLRPFSSPATIPYVACDQCTTATGTAPLPHSHPLNSTVLYNWAPQPVPVGSTTVLNHASFGLMSAHTPPPAAPSGPSPGSGRATNAEQVCERQTQAGAESLQTAQDQDNSPQESGYYSSNASPTPNHHR